MFRRRLAGGHSDCVRLGQRLASMADYSIGRLLWRMGGREDIAGAHSLKRKKDRYECWSGT